MPTGATLKSFLAGPFAKRKGVHISELTLILPHWRLSPMYSQRKNRVHTDLYIGSINTDRRRRRPNSGRRFTFQYGSINTRLPQMPF